ncbi:MAG: phosphatase PAP2 family protein [Chitinophagales bacterium]
MDFLRSIDTSLLLFFNGLHNGFLDYIMYWSSNKWIWIPFYMYLAFFLYRKYPQQIIPLLIFAAVLISLSDQISSSVIKNAVMRLRPCHNPNIASQLHLVNGYCGGQYGFVSSHASNSFALIAFLVLLFRKQYKGLQWILLGWALLVSYSRIYLAAHYPADVFCGALFGIVLAILVFSFYQVYLSYFSKSPPLIP